MTDQERIDRAARAKRALDEFLTPAFEVLHTEYTRRMTDIASTAPWDANRITALANATRIVEEVKRQIVGIVFDGEAAKDARNHAQRVEQLSPARRRLAGIVPY